jgi:ribosomal protein S21
MKIIAEVKKLGNESPAALIRRFTKRVQSTQALVKVREERYFTRKMSKLKLKRRALVGMGKKTTYDRLKKLGKIPEKVHGEGRRG